MINKIHPELLKYVSTLSSSNIDCFVYANDLNKLKIELYKHKINYTAYPFMQCFYTSIPYSKMMALCKYPCVKFITKTTQVFTLIDRAKQFMNMDKAKLPNSSSTIAVIDTGINPHLDFLLPYNRIVHFKDLINNHTYPYDDNGHGTFISGICAGSGVCSQFKYSGIVPKSNIVMIKALDKSGETTSQTILDAMQYIYDIRKKYNIKVVCMSFGADYSGTNDPLQKGALALWNCV